MNTESVHPNSLAASKDPEIRARIRKGRAKAAADDRAMESWANNGFVAGTEWTSGGLMKEEREV